MANYTKTAVHGTLIVLVVSLLAAFFAYLVRLVLARNLPMEEFGLFYAVFAFLGLFAIFSTLGFDRALAKFIPEFLHEKKYSDIKSSISYSFIVQLLSNSIIILVVYALSNYLSSNYFHNEKAGIVLKIIVIAFFVDSFVQVIKSSFQGFKKMVYFSGIDLARMIILLTAIIIGIKLNLGILGAATAYIIAPLILIIIFGILLFKVFPEYAQAKVIFSRLLFKKMSKYSIFVLAASFAGFILFYTDTIMLTYFAGLTSVALYNVALPTAKLLLYFPRAIGGIFLPLTSEFWAKKENALLAAGVESLYKYSAIIIIPAVFIIFSFSDLIINAFFGSNYAASSSALKILIVGMIFATINAISTNIFSGIGKPEINSKIIYSAAAFNFVGNLVMIPLWGINGAAFTTTLSYFIMMVMGLIDTRRFIAIKLPIFVWAKTLIAGLSLVGLIWILKKALYLNLWLESGIILIVSGAVYAALLFSFKIITLTEIKSIYSRIMN